MRKGLGWEPKVFTQTKEMGLSFPGDQRQPLIGKEAGGGHRADAAHQGPDQIPLSVNASPAPAEGLE